MRDTLYINCRYIITMAVTVVDPEARDPKKDLNTLTTFSSSENEDLQQGETEIATVWNKKLITIAYLMIWVIYFFELMQRGIEASLAPYVLSEFANHSLTPVVLIMSSVFGGVFNLALAKVLDLFGRPLGCLVSVIVATFGLAMMAACNSVEMYSVAQIFYSLGNHGLMYCLGVFIADTSSLRNRGLMWAFTYSPNLITSFMAGPISESFFKGLGWRWFFGSFAIMLPLVNLPLFILFIYTSRKAKQMGLKIREKVDRTKWQSVKHYVREFDAPGLLLLTVGLAFILLPINIYRLQPDGWGSPLIITMIVLGVVAIIAFVIWEKYLTPVTFIPYELILDRTIFGACVLAGILLISIYCWSSYFISWLQVALGLDIRNASYIAQIYGLGAVFWCIVMGFFIRYTGRYKAPTLYFAVPGSILGLSLMIYFRQPNVHVGWIIMCQIIMCFTGGTIFVCVPVAIMAAASDKHVSVLLAIEGMFAEIGGAIGLSIASTIWQTSFPKKLAEYLPEKDQPDLLKIYRSLQAQLSYPIGTDTRIAIQQAYSDSQQLLSITGTAIWVIGLAATIGWKDINVKNVNKVHGTH